MGWFVPLSDGYIPQNILRTSPVELSNEVKTQTCKNIDAVKFSAKAQIGQTIVVKSVDANDIPTEWEATDAMVINSSTEGSTKKFKITVDDSGTIAAIEV